VWANKKAYVLVLAIIVIPSDIFSIALSLNDNDLTAAYLSIAAVVMNVALLWTIARRAERETAPSFGEAYYAGSEAIVRYALTSVAVIAMLVPLAFGGSLYANGLETTQTSNLSGGVLLIIGLVSLLIAAPSVYLMVRYGLSTFAAVEDGLTPIAALKRSRRISLGRFWPVAARLVFLAVIVIVVLVPIGVVTLGLSLVRLGGISTGFFEILTTLIGLPIVNVYLFHLYRDLKSTASPEALSVDAAEETAE